MATGATAPPQKRRVRKRILIPSVLLALLALVFLWLWWRGTSADSAERNPTTVADGAVKQLITQDGRTSVRCAIIVDAKPAAVWQVVSAYDQHPKFMPYMVELASEKLADGRLRLRGVAQSRIWGDWPFEIDVTHDEKPAHGEYTSRWHEEGKTGFTINRGGWTLKPHGTDQTLLVFNKQVEISGHSNFLVRNIILDRVGSVLRAVRDETHKRK